MACALLSNMGFVYSFADANSPASAIPVSYSEDYKLGDTNFMQDIDQLVYASSVPVSIYEVLEIQIKVKNC